jgi:hypothetical protein
MGDESIVLSQIPIILHGHSVHHFIRVDVSLVDFVQFAMEMVQDGHIKIISMASLDGTAILPHLESLPDKRVIIVRSQIR